MVEGNISKHRQSHHRDGYRSPRAVRVRPLYWEPAQVMVVEGVVVVGGGPSSTALATERWYKKKEKNWDISATFLTFHNGKFEICKCNDVKVSP